MNRSASICLNVYVLKGFCRLMVIQAQHPLLLVQPSVAFCFVSLVLPYLLILVLQGVRHGTSYFRLAYMAFLISVQGLVLNSISSRLRQFLAYIVPLFSCSLLLTFFLSLLSILSQLDFVQVRGKKGGGASQQRLWGTRQCLGQVSGFREEAYNRKILKNFLFVLLIPLTIYKCYVTSVLLQLFSLLWNFHSLGWYKCLILVPYQPLADTIVLPLVFLWQGGPLPLQVHYRLIRFPILYIPFSQSH